MFFKFILYSIVIFLIFRLARFIYRLILNSNTQQRTNFQNTGKKKSSIDKKDIIEADFEEIKESKESGKKE